MSLRDDILALFSDGKAGTGYIRCKCPFHKGGMERRPSMSILTEPKDGRQAGFAKCFTCGWTGDFADIAEYFGYQYIADSAISITPEQFKPDFQVHTQSAVYKKDVPYQYSPYLASRGIFEATQKQFKVYEKPEENKVYLPVFSRTGQYMYANARSTDKKMFFVDHGAKKSLAGLEEVDFAKPIAIVESQINMLSLYQSQFCRAVATLGATNLQPLRALAGAAGPFLLMFDGDDAGKKATEDAKELLGAYRCVVFKFPPNKDVNDIWQDCNFDCDKFFTELEKLKEN